MRGKPIYTHIYIELTIHTFRDTPINGERKRDRERGSRERYR